MWKLSFPCEQNHFVSLAAEDYLPITQRVVTFAPGLTSSTQEVRSLSDSEAESVEQFSVVLSSPSAGVSIGNGVATVIIRGTMI